MAIVYSGVAEISIHALLAESDGYVRRMARQAMYISIHALLAESDARMACTVIQIVLFLSTLSLRRATITGTDTTTDDQTFLSTLSLRRATPQILGLATGDYYISIHALLAESDSRPRRIKSRRMVFLSTLSLRRATIMHALILTDAMLFLSTLSLRRATGHAQPIGRARFISIHALFGVCDASVLLVNGGDPSFLSTLSLRRATDLEPSKTRRLTFLSTLSLRRATAKVHKTVGHFCAYGTNFMGIASSC